MIILIDNYDSFSYNLFQLVGELRPDIQVIKNDAYTVEEILAMKPEKVNDYEVKVNNSPVSPNVKKRALLAGFAGAFLVALIIIILDLMDNTVKTTEVLSEKFKKPILGEIQNIEETQKRRFGKRKVNLHENEQRRTLLDKDIPFYVVESCKSLRTNVNFALSTNDKKVLAVSSANPSEGKSTTAANLAITMAESGKKVLLIDADLRKNVQNRIFKVKNEKGLSSVISRMHHPAHFG